MVINTGLFVDEKCRLSVRKDLPIPAPAEGEVQVETLFSSVNPADVLHAPLLGVYPVVIGYDYCGRVLRTGPNSKFAPGDVVAGMTPTGIGRELRWGTHQDYISGPEDTAFAVPQNLPPSHAACLPVIVQTAADVLYSLFKLPAPFDIPRTKYNRGPLLIWGGSTGVGLSTLQLAHAAGIFPIFVAASPARHGLLGKLGATQCFDYNSPGIVSEIQAAVDAGGAGPISCALDAAGASNSADLMASCVCKNTTLASVLHRSNPQFLMPLAIMNRDVQGRPAGAPTEFTFTIPARPEDWKVVRKALEWVVENYGDKFSLPSVEVFHGSAEEALAQVQGIGERGRGFGKLVLQHPFL